MPNYNTVIWKNQDLSLRQIQCGGKDDDLILSHIHNLGMKQVHNCDLGTGSFYHDKSLNSEPSSEKRSAFRQTHEQDLAMQHAHDENPEGKGLGLERDASPVSDRDQSEVEDSEIHLALTPQSHGIGLSENRDLSIIENQDFHENFELELDQNQEMIIPQTHYVDDAPVLQSRTQSLVPSHQLTVGQEFSDVKSCRRALRDAAIANRFEMKTIKSDKSRFTAKCASEGCPWRIHVAKLPGIPTFTIRTIHGEHTCGGITHLGHQQASVQWVADAVEERLKVNPNYKPKEILEDIHRMHGITLSYKQAWRGKERFMATVHGSFEEDYRLLPQYCDQIRMKNPGSIALVYGNPVDRSFQRLFISFQASIYGFLHACRPLIGLSKAPLKTKYLGTLLFATAFDGDGGLFPLAFGVVDEENDDNWMWFLSELRNLLETNAEYMPKLTILSDRQKGVIEGVDVNFPSAFHGLCMHHLIDSFLKEFNSSVLINLVSEAAQALSAVEFESKILEIEQVSEEAACWIRCIPPRLWATSYFEGTRLGQLAANIPEFFNCLIPEASGLPIIQMIEHIRRQMMTWFNERREMSMQWMSTLVPSAEQHVSDALHRANIYRVLKASEAEFEVVSDLEGSFSVNLHTRGCVCRGWQVWGLPCAHAVAALISCRQNVHRFTESYFTVASYRKAYSQTIHPIPDRTLWKENDWATDSEVVINPPKSLRPSGEPRKRRVRTDSNSRGKRVVHCSRCNQVGHFRTTCVAPI